MRTRPPLLVVSSLLLLAACEDKPEPPLAPVSAKAVAAPATVHSRRDKLRVIARMKSRADVAPAAAAARGLGARVVREFRRYPLLALEVNANALDGIRHMKGVLSVREDRLSRPTLDNSLPVINADDVRALNWTGTGLTVVILDTGFDLDHPFFGPRIVAQACYSSGPESLCPNGDDEQTGNGSADAMVSNCFDGSVNMCTHGSHVAGIAAGNGAGLTIANAQAAGVAPGANIIAIQVFSRFTDDDDCDGNAPCVLTYDTDQIAAMEHVRDDLAGSFTISSLNMSLGGGMYTENCDDDDNRTDVIDDLRSANIAAVISAGNDSYADAVSAPGCISSAITIGSTDNSDNISSFSNRGSLLELFAPGSGIMSSVPDNAFGTKSGTSMAAPHVTGAWAVLRQSKPSLTVSQVLSILQTTGVPITNGSGTTPRINLLAALRATTNPPVVTATTDPVVVNEGITATNTGTWSDPDGDPVTLTKSIGSLTKNADGTWSWSFATNDGPSQSQTVRIIAADNRDARDTASFTLTVQNVAPTVNAGPDATIISKQLFNFSGSFSDPGTVDMPWAWSIDWGDGTALATGSTNSQAAAINRSHQYCAARNYTVTFKVKDKDNGEGSDDLTLTVNYLSVGIDITPAQFPNAVSLSNQGLQPVALLSSATFDARQADPSKVTLGDGVGTETPVAKRSNGRYYADVEDVNKDGRPDVIFRFSVPQLVANGDVTPASTVLYLTGYLADGCTNFRGSDSIRPNP